MTGIFPESWKHAPFVPVRKNGDAANVSNYLPISLPILSKVLEKIVSTQLVNYQEENNLLSKTQHGFRPKLSTATALTVVTDEIHKNMDSKKVSLLTLCDLSKVFDSVNHSILLEKRENTAFFFYFFYFYVVARLHRRPYQPLWCWSEAGPLVVRASVYGGTWKRPMVPSQSSSLLLCN